MASANVPHSNVLPFFPPKIILESTDSCCSSTVEDASLDHAKDYHSFALSKLAWAIQNGLSVQSIERYINKFESSTVRSQLCFGVHVGFEVPCCPILFFAIEQNSPELVRLLCKAGAITSHRASPSGLPVLAYAVLCAEHTMVDTTDVLITLLAVGADPKDVPVDMWQDPLKAPVKEVSKSIGMTPSQEGPKMFSCKDMLCNLGYSSGTLTLWF